MALKENSVPFIIGRQNNKKNQEKRKNAEIYYAKSTETEQIWVNDEEIKNEISQT